jgi:hypothetical protein
MKRITLAAILLASAAYTMQPAPAHAAASMSSLGLAIAGDAAIAIPAPAHDPLEVVQDWIKRGLRQLASVLTNAGRDIVTNRILGSGTEPKFIGWGTTVATALVTDTTLGAEKAADLTATTGTRVTGTSSRVTTSVTNDTYQVTGTYTATGAGTVTNAGLFDSATIAAGNLYVKGDFTGVALAIGDSIAFTFKHQLT